MIEKLRRWLSWESSNAVIWVWHAIFDGMKMCPCSHSRYYRRVWSR